MKKLTTYLPDALMIGGAAALSYGAGLAWLPAGYLVGGLLCLAAGILTARAAR